MSRIIQIHQIPFLN